MVGWLSINGFILLDSFKIKKKVNKMFDFITLRRKNE